jgi:hypothetical protein
MNLTGLAIISARSEDGAMYYTRGGFWADHLEGATMMRIKVAERLVSLKRKQIQMQRAGDRWLYGLTVRRIALVNAEEGEPL